MINPKHAIFDTSLATSAILSPFWWPTTLEGWLQCALAGAGIILMLVRIWRAIRNGDRDE